MSLVFRIARLCGFMWLTIHSAYSFTRQDDRVAEAEENLRNGKLTQAVALLDEVLKADPENIRALTLLEWASLLLQLNGKFQERADVGKVSPADVPPGNTGGKWIFASPGLSLQITDVLSAYSFVQIPVYQKVNGIQQTAKINLQFGLSANFGLLE
mgnify:CR=1 FL=1